MADNLAIYNAVRFVPEEAKRKFSNGRFSGTDINPMWRIKTLTEQFGPAGIGWYYEVVSERQETLGADIIAVVDIKLYIKLGDEWSKPIYGTGGNILLSKGRPSDEGYKMALTDALSVACKALGIGADVYFEKDTTKYTAPQAEPQKPSEPQDRRVQATQQMNSDLENLRRAEPSQIAYLEQHCDETQYMLLMQKYGSDLSRLSFTTANKLIDKLKKGA